MSAAEDDPGRVSQPVNGWETNELARAGLILLSGFIALLVISPMAWLIWEALSVDPSRAFSLVFSTQTAMITLNSLVLMVLVTLASIAIGVPLAILTTGTDLPYPRLCTVIAALPLVIPSYIGAIAFTGMFGPGGEVDAILGLPLPRIAGLPGSILIITLYTYPYVFLTTRAALLSMDRGLVEAARSLNAGPFTVFRRVTYPQVRPGIAAGALLTALYAISDFGTPAFMRASVFTSSIYWESRGFAIEYAALLSLQLIAIVAVVLVIEAGIGRDRDASSVVRQGSVTRLGWWKWPAIGSVGLLGLLTIVVPIAIFMIWLVRGAGDPIPSLAFQWTFAWHSVHLAILAAIVACLFALPIAYFAGREQSLLARGLERVTYIGFAIPGVVIGLALVFLGTRTLPGLYRQGVALLIFAYVVRFLPQAVGTVRSSVLQIDETTFEAAKSLGAGRIEVFRRITLPQIMPGIIAGAVLVFLTTMKELPITLMLQPIGMDTLVIIIWESQRILAYRYAAIPGLLLVLISGATMLVLLSQEDASFS